MEQSFCTISTKLLIVEERILEDGTFAGNLHFENLMLVPSLFDQTVKMKSQFSLKLDHVTNDMLCVWLFFFKKKELIIQQILVEWAHKIFLSMYGHFFKLNLSGVFKKNTH